MDSHYHKQYFNDIYRYTVFIIQNLSRVKHWVHLSWFISFPRSSSNFSFPCSSLLPSRRYCWRVYPNFSIILNGKRIGKLLCPHLSQSPFIPHMLMLPHVSCFTVNCLVPSNRVVILDMIGEATWYKDLTYSPWPSHERYSRTSGSKKFWSGPSCYRSFFTRLQPWWSHLVFSKFSPRFLP